MCAMRPRTIAAIGLLCALTAITAGSRPAAAAGKVIPFIADDYAKAVAEARARKVPLFIESWAPW